MNGGLLHQQQFNILQKRAALEKKTLEGLKEKANFAFLEMQEAVKEASYRISSMSDKQFTKTAQLLVNGYPKHGKKLVTLLAHMSRKDDPELIQASSLQ